MRGLTAEQRYLFDLRGFIILRNTISSQEIADARNAISGNLHKFYERKDGLRNSRLEAFQGDKQRGRLDCGTILHWDKPHCDVFRRFLAIPKVIHVLNEVCGKGYRLDHLPLAILQYKNAEGFDLHGGNVDEAGNWQQDLSYDCRNGKICCNLVNVAIPLDETRDGDGGFVVIPGSHKANFGIPPSLAECPDNSLTNEYLVNPKLSPGDILIFSEAATHGALPWRGTAECRRTLFYRYCPANYAYGRGYLHNFRDIIDELSEAERNVLQPPFANRLDRAEVDNEGNVSVNRRSDAKKQFDKEVFECDYF